MDGIHVPTIWKSTFYYWLLDYDMEVKGFILMIFEMLMIFRTTFNVGIGKFIYVFLIDMDSIYGFKIVLGYE